MPEALLPQRPELRVIVTSATIDPQRFAELLRRRADHRGVGPQLSGRRALSAAHRGRRRGLGAVADRGHRRGRAGAATARIAATCWCSCPARSRSARRPKRSARRACTRPKCCRCIRACRRAIRSGFSRSTARAASCSRPTSPRPRSPCRACARRRLGPGAHQSLQRARQSAAPADRADLAGERRQRKGRCGRESPGICIRLYAEDDFVCAPAFTPPEVLRTNLASVILQMAALSWASRRTFPFVDPPDTRLINDGYGCCRS